MAQNAGTKNVSAPASNLPERHLEIELASPKMAGIRVHYVCSAENLIDPGSGGA